MTEEEWKQRYIERLMARGGLSVEEAEDIYEAGEKDRVKIGDDDPIEAADEEISYWPGN